MNPFSSQRRNKNPEARSEDLHFERLWRSFTRRFPNDESCWAEMKRLIRAFSLFRCELCGCHEFVDGKARSIFCASCSFKSSVTTGNLFERIRLPKPWLAAIWFMERGFSLSSYRLHRLVGVAQSTALNILRKVRTVLELHMREPEKVFAQSEFNAVMNRRSRSTPANKHPVSEEESPDPKQAASEDMEDTSTQAGENKAEGDKFEDCGQQSNDAGNLDPDVKLWQRRVEELEGNAKTVFEILSQTVPLSIDEICSKTGLAAGKVAAAITILEMDELIECPFTNNYLRSTPGRGRQPAASCKTSTGAGFVNRLGGAFRGSEPNNKRQFRSGPGISNLSDKDRGAKNKSVEEEVEEEELRMRLFKYLFQSFDGVSRKYLQLYLASFWCFSDRAYWFAGQLFRACFQSSPVTYAELLLYSSPPELKVIESKKRVAHLDVSL